MTDPFEDLVELRRRWGGRTPPPPPAQPETVPFNPRIEGRKRLLALREILEVMPSEQSKALLVYWDDAARAFAALLQLGAAAPEPASKPAAPAAVAPEPTSKPTALAAAAPEPASKPAAPAEPITSAAEAPDAPEAEDGLPASADDDDPEESAEAEETIDDPHAMLTEAFDRMEELLEAFGMG